MLPWVGDNNKFIIKNLFDCESLIIPFCCCSSCYILFSKEWLHTRSIWSCDLRSTNDLFLIFWSISNRFMQKYRFFISCFHAKELSIKSWEFFSLSYLKSDSWSFFYDFTGGIESIINNRCWSGNNGDKRLWWEWCILLCTTFSSWKRAGGEDGNWEENWEEYGKFWHMYIEKIENCPLHWKISVDIILPWSIYCSINPWRIKITIITRGMGHVIYNSWRWTLHIQRSSIILIKLACECTWSNIFYPHGYVNGCKSIISKDILINAFKSEWKHKRSKIIIFKRTCINVFNTFRQIYIVKVIWSKRIRTNSGNSRRYKEWTSKSFILKCSMTYFLNLNSVNNLW